MGEGLEDPAALSGKRLSRSDVITVSFRLIFGIVIIAMYDSLYYYILFFMKEKLHWLNTWLVLSVATNQRQVRDRRIPYHP